MNDNAVKALTFLRSETTKRKMLKTAASEQKKTCTPTRGCTKDQRNALEAMLPGKCLHFAGQGGFSCVFHDDEGTAYKMANKNDLENKALATEKYNKLKDVSGVLAMQLHDAGDGKGYFSGEMCTHGNLEEYSKHASAEDLAHVLQQVIPAFASLHRAGFLHGDVKPQNMVVCDNRTLKLIDYGDQNIPVASFSTNAQSINMTPMYNGLVKWHTRLVRHATLWESIPEAAALWNEYERKDSESRSLRRILDGDGDQVFVKDGEIRFVTTDRIATWKKKQVSGNLREKHAKRLQWFESATPVGTEEAKKMIGLHKARLRQIKSEIKAILDKVPPARAEYNWTISDMRAAHYSILMCICNFYGMRMKEKDTRNLWFKALYRKSAKGIRYLKYHFNLQGWLALSKLKHVPEASMHPALYRMMQHSLSELLRKPKFLHIPEWLFLDNGEMDKKVILRKIDNDIYDKSPEEIYNEEYVIPLGLVEFEVTQNENVPTRNEKKLQLNLDRANERIKELERKLQLK